MPVPLDALKLPSQVVHDGPGARPLGAADSDPGRAGDDSDPQASRLGGRGGHRDHDRCQC